MGQNQTAPQLSMDDLLTSLRKVIEPGKSADDVQLAMPAPAAETPANSNNGRAAVRISSSEEIVNLRKRIARNWERNGQPNGFATLLAGGAAANPAPPPALLEDRSLERIHPLESDPEPGLRQTLRDSDEAGFDEISTQSPRLEALTRQPETRSPASPSWASIARDRDESRNRTLMSEHSTAAANASFNRFAETLMSRALSDRSLEDMTREVLRGMLKQWLDDHLPQLVERIVRDEIERVARRGDRR